MVYLRHWARCAGSTHVGIGVLPFGSGRKRISAMSRPPEFGASLLQI